MKDFFDFLREIIQTGLERLKFPIFNSFLISWAILNWKAILIILYSDRSIEERINTVVKFHTDPFINFIIPAGVAFLYMFGFPQFKNWLHLNLEGINRKNREDSMDYVISSFEKKKLLAEKEVEVEQIRAHYMELRELNEKKKELEGKVKNLVTETENLKKEIEKEKRKGEGEKKRLDSELSRSKSSRVHYEDRSNRYEELADDMTDFFDYLPNYNSFLGKELYGGELNDKIKKFKERAAKLKELK